ncbi:putative DNA primase [Bacillus phage BSP7]|nr:putative DNA primase [Bacillus phage BSP7]
MLPYTKFYSKFVKLPKSDEVEVAIRCPFHNDSNPSLYINLQSGSWHCKSCDAGVDGGGHIADWLTEWFDIPLKEALKQKNVWDAQGDIKIPIDPQVVYNLHQNLVNDEKALKRFIQARGYDLNTIKEYMIGFEPDTGRYTFPVIGPRGDIINIRRYKMGAKKAKFINVKHALTLAKLWPLDEDFFNASWVVLFEGEPDTGLARQLGVPAMTSTGGAGSFPDGVAHYFRNKRVFICYDPDEAGQQGATRAAMAIRDEAKEVRIGKMPKDMDFTDFIMEGHTVEEFYSRVLAKSKVFEPPIKSEIDDSIETPTDFEPVSLTQATNNPGYNNKGVQLNVVVQGREGMPYSAPKTVKVSCPFYNPEATKCKDCMLANLTREQQEEGYDFHFNRSREVINFIDAPDDKVNAILKQSIGIPTNCHKPTIDTTEAYNIETLFIATEVAKFSNAITDDDMNAQKAYYIYESEHSPIKANKSYTLEAMRTTNPKDGSVIFVILGSKPLRSDIELFKPSAIELEDLKIFQPKPGQSVKEKMYEIAEDLSYHTRIWGRPELTIAYDLVYHSILRFHFQNKLQHRGYLELLVIGDTRTGKTETGSSLVEYYGQGDFIEGENTRLTGLTGTVTQLGGGQWSIVWGKFPLNDRRLLVVDEASGLEKDDWGQISGMRSRGIVEINKAKSDKAYARVRTIWISNPRAAKLMRDYDYGARAINDLIGRFEDVARLDFALGVGKDDIPQDIVNRDIVDLPQSPQTYTAELCQRLILWAWSRNATGRITLENDAVEFTREATLAILKQASHLGDLFEDAPVNLVERNSMKIKLARLSAACAARLFSTDEEMQKVIVTEEHVNFIAEFLIEQYSNKALDYRGLAQEAKRRHDVTPEQQAEIFRFFEMHENVIAELRKKTKPWTSNHVAEAAGIDIEEAKDIIAEMHRLDLIFDAKQGGVAYMMTHKWNTQLQLYERMSQEEREKIMK